MKSKIGILIISGMIMLSSCYQRELVRSFEESSGGVMVGSSCYYLAQLREYRNPKGISRFPDGGQAKEIRQIFGLFKTDSISKKTILAARLGDVYGWPVRYKTRLEKNNSDIAIGIVNINLPDAINGIYLYNFDSGRIIKYSVFEALPALSETGTKIAFCSNKLVYVEDYSEKIQVATYPVDTVPVFISWGDENKILLFCSDPFRVMELNLKTGKIDSSDMKYISNYKQELGAADIKNIVTITTSELRKLIDNQ
jgi:hypothetical protein